MKKVVLVVAIIVAALFILKPGWGQPVEVHGITNEAYDNLYKTHNTFRLEIDHPKKPVEVVVEKYEDGKRVYSQGWLEVGAKDSDRSMFGFIGLKDQVCVDADFNNSECFNIRKDAVSFKYDLNKQSIDLSKHKEVILAYFGTGSKAQSGFPVNMNKLKVQDFKNIVLIKVRTK